MTHEEAFLQAMVDDPTAALLFADWLEERGDPRGELLRLTYFLTRSVDQPNRPALEERLLALVAAGVRPVGPFRTNAVGMTFAWVPPGAFLMGSPPNEPERSDDETQHRVTLTKGFWMGVHQVTQVQWQAVMGTNPSEFKGNGNLPVENVSWDDCVAFCEALGRRDGKAYRLPTEAEWEYACRAGTTTPFHFGATISTDQANYNGYYPYNDGRSREDSGKTTPVGSFPGNAWRLFDVHGNVFEWCQDLYAPYQEGDIIDPFNRTKGQARVLRGGSWFFDPRFCRAAYRRRLTRGFRIDNIGCRVCLD